MEARCGMFEPDNDKQLQVTPQIQAVPLSITTRAVGFATAIVYQRTCAAWNIESIAEIATIHEVYRVHLMLAHLKVYLVQQQQHEQISVEGVFKRIYLAEELLDELNLVKQVPSVVGTLLDCIGKAEADKRVWHVGYPQCDNSENYMEYRSLVITPDNIRETLNFLSNEQSPAAARVDFIDHNSIPGSHFVNGILVNANEIWPIRYGAQELLVDIHKYNGWVRRVKTRLPFCAFSRTAWSDSGTIGSLWSTERLKMKLTSTFGTDENEAIPKFLECTWTTVNAVFWSSVETSHTNIELGATSLIGEVCCIETRHAILGHYRVTINPVSAMLNLLERQEYINKNPEKTESISEGELEEFLDAEEIDSYSDTEFLEDNLENDTVASAEVATEISERVQETPNIADSLTEQEIVDIEPLKRAQLQTLNTATVKTSDEPSKKCQKRKNFKCADCDKSFVTNQKLRQHHLVHTKARDYECPVCAKRFATIYRQRDHLKIHTNERNFSCEFCEKAFTTRSTLKIHLQCHSDARPYECEVCGKCFQQRSILKTHMSLHNGKHIECVMCQRRFSRVAQLHIHQRTHSGERPYKCIHCNNTYLQKSHLDRHVNVHLGVRFNCAYCDKVYTKKTTLDTHIQQVHVRSAIYTCTACDLSYDKQKSYYYHMKKHHPKMPSTDDQNDPKSKESNV